MTQTKDPLENAIVKRINKTIKEQFTKDKQIKLPGIRQPLSKINHHFTVSVYSYWV